MSIELQSMKPIGNDFGPPPYTNHLTHPTTSCSSGSSSRSIESSSRECTNESRQCDRVCVDMTMGAGHVMEVDQLTPDAPGAGVFNKAFEAGVETEQVNWVLQKPACNHKDPDSHVTEMASTVSDRTGKTQQDKDDGCFSRTVNGAQAAMSAFSEKYGSLVRHIFYGLLIVGYSGYFAWSLYYEFGSESSIRLLWITMVANALVIIVLIRDNVGAEIYNNVFMSPVRFIKRHFNIFKWTFICACAAGFVIFIGVEIGPTSSRNLVSFSGIVIYVLLLFLFSANPGKVRWRPVFWGLGLQFVFGLIVLRTAWGYEAFKWLGDRVQEFMEYSDAGAEFVFGKNFTDHFFAFKVLPVVVFFSATISILYYLGTMQTIILKIAWVMQRTLGTTAAESVNAAGNIFVGHIEAPLLIRPLINDMTVSELHAVMTAGAATIAGSVLATYISIGVSPNHLISASIMAAPCALALSKLSYPETEKSETTAENVNNMETGPERNVIEAASAGASAAISLVANIAVNLIAFISLLTFLNTVLTWMGHRAGMWPPTYPELTFELICSYVLWPFAYVMGVSEIDCRKVAELIGIKMFLNEFVAYTNLGIIIDNSELFEQHMQNNGTYECLSGSIILDGNVTLVGGVMQPRSIAISTYALCGFANVSAIGTMIGALSSMAPHRRSEIASMAIRAMLTGTIVSCVNACTAGLLYQGGEGTYDSVCQF